MHSDITSAVLHGCMDVKQEINPKAFIFNLPHSFLMLPNLKPQKNCILEPPWCKR